MPKKGRTEEQIIGALKQYGGGEKTADICRELGVSQAQSGGKPSRQRDRPGASRRRLRHHQSAVRVRQAV